MNSENYSEIKNASLSVFEPRVVRAKLPSTHDQTLCLRHMLCGVRFSRNNQQSCREVCTHQNSSSKYLDLEPGCTLCCPKCPTSYIVYTREGDAVCDECATVIESSMVAYSAKERSSVTRRSSNYLRIYHWHERMRFWCMSGPPIPDNHFNRICNKLKGFTGIYTREVIESACTQAGLKIYRERWKSLLHIFNGPLAVSKIPSPELVGYMCEMFIKLEEPFDKFVKTSMPVSKKRNRYVRFRHNFINYNYVAIKILESIEVYEFHDEFPQLKTDTKISALDDAMEIMCKHIGMPFRRSLEPPAKKHCSNSRLFLQNTRSK